MALVPHKITALAESDAQGTDGKNIVAGAVVSLYDTNGTAVTLFDDESGTNGSTAKQTDATGQVVVFVTAGEYDEEVNGSIKRRVLIGSKELTTEQLIDSVRNYQAGDVITTTGFANGGDGGAAQWKATATTGLTPSQTPADRGTSELVDGSGRLWELVAVSGTSAKEVVITALGADMSGTTNQDLIIEICKNISANGGVCIAPCGEILTGQIVLNDEKLYMRGAGKGLTTIKLDSGTNSNNIQLTGTGLAELTLDGVTIDGNKENQTGGGHGIRSAGCARFELKDVRIYNALNYGIGLQAGTSNGCKWEGIEIDTVGSDAIDIKDLNFNNGVININGLIAKNYGIDNTQSPALDVRGPVSATNLEVHISGDNYGVRGRLNNVQGRDAQGCVTGLTIIGDGASNSQAVRFEGSSPDFIVSSVSIKDCSLPIVFGSTSVGGQACDISASGAYGGDCISIGGQDNRISNLTLTNTAAASRIVDIESTAINAQLDGFYLDDNTTEANPIRVNSGAVDSFIRGTLKGGGVNDQGTNTVADVRLI